MITSAKYCAAATPCLCRSTPKLLIQCSKQKLNRILFEQWRHLVNLWRESYILWPSCASVFNVISTRINVITHKLTYYHVQNGFLLEICNIICIKKEGFSINFSFLFFANNFFCIMYVLSLETSTFCLDRTCRIL